MPAFLCAKSKHERPNATLAQRGSRNFVARNAATMLEHKKEVRENDKPRCSGLRITKKRLSGGRQYRRFQRQYGIPAGRTWPVSRICTPRNWPDCSWGFWRFGQQRASNRRRSWHDRRSRREDGKSGPRSGNPVDERKHVRCRARSADLRPASQWPRRGL
jgi:hypothetical protein